MSEKIAARCETHGDFGLPVRDVEVVDIKNRTCHYRFSCPKDSKTILIDIPHEVGEWLVKRGCEYTLISELVIDVEPIGGSDYANSNITEEEIAVFSNKLD